MIRSEIEIDKKKIVEFSIVCQSLNELMECVVQPVTNIDTTTCTMPFQLFIILCKSFIWKWFGIYLSSSFNGESVHYFHFFHRQTQPFTWNKKLFAIKFGGRASERTNKRVNKLSCIYLLFQNYLHVEKCVHATRTPAHKFNFQKSKSFCLPHLQLKYLFIRVNNFYFAFFFPRAKRITYDFKDHSAFWLGHSIKFVNKFEYFFLKCLKNLMHFDFKDKPKYSSSSTTSSFLNEKKVIGTIYEYPFRMVYN